MNDNFTEQDAISNVALRYYNYLLPTLLRSLTTNENEPLCEKDYRAVWVLLAASELQGVAQDDFEMRMDALTVEAIADLAVENWERDIPSRYRIDREVISYSSFDDLLAKVREQYILFYNEHLHLFQNTPSMWNDGILARKLYLSLWETFVTENVECDPPVMQNVFLTGIKLHAFERYEEDILGG